MLRCGRESELVDLRWTERGWSATPHVRTFPAILERLAGTPARAAALGAGVPEALLAKRMGGKWSVKEHLGHLSDLHALDMSRRRTVKDAGTTRSSPTRLSATMNERR
jgi:hypothetical protein